MNTGKCSPSEVRERGITFRLDMESFVGSVDGSYDNVLAETINELYKAEVNHRQSWKSHEALGLAMLTWVVGGLVQPSMFAGAGREESANGSQSQLPSTVGRSGYDELTCTKWSPGSPDNSFFEKDRPAMRMTEEDWTTGCQMRATR